MKKRILSLLLAFLMVISNFNMPVYAENTAGKTTVSENSVTEDQCPYCEEDTAEDGDVIHAEDCNTFYEVDASADVGKTAAFNAAFGEVLYVDEKPTADFVYDPTDEAYGFIKAIYDPDDPALVEITNWFWEVSGPTLWYQVAPLAGENLPEGLTTESWILQRYTNEADPLNTLVLTSVDMIGKTVEFSNATSVLYGSFSDAYYEENGKEVNPFVFTYMKVTDLYTDGDFVWYYVDAAEGENWPEAYAEYHYVLADDVALVDVCPECGDPGCTEEHDYCSFCGGTDCNAVHNICGVCGETNCMEIHLYCRVCQDYFCEEVHVYCPYCDTYNSCDINHIEENRPVTVPVLPEKPVLPEGMDIAVFDASGELVSDVLHLSAGQRTSISAWGTQDGASYQWQICYDMENDLWTDIKGQTGKGLIVSPAMFLSVLGEQGSTAVRCIMTSGKEKLVSEAVSVKIRDTDNDTAFNLKGRIAAANTAKVLAADAGDEKNTVNVIVNYIFGDNEIAAAPWAATLPAGVAYSTPDPITVPEIAGYTPVIGEGGNAANAELDGYSLSLDFSAEDLKSDCSLNIVYQPAPVKVVVNHHLQNEDDDNYALYETKELSLVTGTTVGDVQQKYEGFYSLLYERPVVAADGSTVIDVYYDRYYYLINFELSGGYGADPIYARYGSKIEADTPTRPGYHFAGWSLNGTTKVDLPATVPGENRKYIALWTPGDPVNYTIVYWKENADDNNYSYWTQQTIKETPGTVVNGSDSVAPYVSDERYFTYNDQLTDKNVVVDGNGSTIVNVYYNRNYYTIYFKGISGDCVIEEHTHGTNCVNELICGSDGHTHNADCERTRICEESEHIHTEDCRSCGLEEHSVHTDACLKTPHEEHTAHTADCLKCGMEVHTHSSDCCMLVVHQHDKGCYDKKDVGNAFFSYNDDYYVKGTEKNGYIGELYVRYQGGEYGYDIAYIYIKGTWYRYNGSAGIGQTVTAKCGTTEHDHTSGCDYSDCSKQVHPAHTASCYKDSLHTHTEDCYKDSLHTHSDSCYNHIEHSHDENCYEYQCGQKPHEHNDSCYRECYKLEHTHTSSCNSNWDENVIYVITAKYEQTIGDIWPTAEKFPNIVLRGWKIDDVSSNAVSKRINMTSDLCDTGDRVKKATAVTGGSKKYLYYMFESFDQSSGPNGNERIRKNGIYYDKSELYYQVVNSSGDFNQKEITGMDKVQNGVVESGSNIFLYYNRKRWNLNFHNVSAVVKTETDIMYEQPLVNYRDDSGNLLSSYVPPYPIDSYEAETMVFEGWYSTPECFEGTQVNFSTLTMPNNDFTLYAKWIPVPRRVRFFLDKSDMGREKTIPEHMAEIYADMHNGAVDANSPYAKFATKDDVPNKSYLSNVTTPGVSAGYEDHPYSGYNFIGWFYIEDGVEKAFDPENIPISRDLDLYGKWSVNVLCPYEVFYALDENGDGAADTDENGAIIYVADSVKGSTLAGNSRTFHAKGDTALYAGYQSGYFPNVASHTIELKAMDSDNDGEQDLTVFTFLYKPSAPVEYTVRYLEEGTWKVLEDPVSFPGNTKAVVTENFVPVEGYMPDKFQKTLVVVPGGENEIIFWYTKDEVHALYQVNHYIQTLDGNGWTEYRTAAFTGELGKNYSADALTIPGFTFSIEKTADYNITQKINAYTGAALPGEVDFDRQDTVSGDLTLNGMQLNLYYTRNMHSYKVQYLEHGTNAVLAETRTVENVPYNTIVTESAVDIEKDMDGDGNNEDFRLYDETKATQTATITNNQTVITFYYVRCRQNLSVSKVVTGNGADEDQSFHFVLESTATDFGGENTAYTYQIGEKQYTTVAVSRRLHFSLKAGETITIFNLPTAKYTVKEQELPRGYYCENPEKTVTLTKDSAASVTVTNDYRPANLTITKTVKVEEVENNTPEVDKFEFTITVPDGVTGSFDYTVLPVIAPEESERVGTVDSDHKITIELKKGQTATFHNLPVGSYLVTEAAYEDKGYDDWYSVDDAAAVDADSAEVMLEAGKTSKIECSNSFPVGDLTIEKIVKKEFYGTDWDGDNFTFVVKRTNKELIENNQYRVLLDGVEQSANVRVNAAKELVVEIAFDQADAERLDEISEQNAYVSHTLTIKGLPAGDYSVSETAAAGGLTNYTTKDNGTFVTLQPGSFDRTVYFTNTLMRKKGDLYLEKLLVPEGDYTGELPVGIQFEFVVELLEAIPSESQVIDVNYSETHYTDGTPVNTSVTMSGGRFTVVLEKDWHVTVHNLPEGKYRITEETIPYYANAFEHEVNGAWVKQPSTSTDNGRMYTEIEVPAKETAKVRCTNTYPVNDAELIIQKLVDKEYDRDVLPGETFTFTVTLTESNVDSYKYFVYDKDGQKVGGERTAGLSADKAFTIELEADQYAVIPNMPVCEYTVSEDVDTDDYNASYKVYVSESGETASETVLTETENASGEGISVQRTFAAGKTDTIVFTNEYLRHLGRLTINKEVTGTTEQDIFLFHIKGMETGNSDINMDVTITGSGSVTIYDLPLGEYLVTEDTDWSWRYANSGAEVSRTLTIAEPDAEVTFTNTYKENKWLNYVTKIANVFKKDEGNGGG